MSTLHFIGGEKGGVGKSLVARLLAQYYIDHGLPFVCFDSDKSHGALLRFYSEYTAPVVVDQYESLDRIIEDAADGSDRRILVDLAAQTHQFLTKWIMDSDLLELSRELGISMVYWHVMDAGKDSVDLLQKVLDQFGGRLRIILVLNELRGSSFAILDASGLRTRAEELGAECIGLSHLQDATMAKIDAHNTSFWAAVNQTDKDGRSLGLLQRQRVKIWLNRAYESFAAVAA